LIDWISKILIYEEPNCSELSNFTIVFLGVSQDFLGQRRVYKNVWRPAILPSETIIRRGGGGRRERV